MFLAGTAASIGSALFGSEPAAPPPPPKPKPPALTAAASREADAEVRTADVSAEEVDPAATPYAPLKTRRASGKALGGLGRGGLGL